MLNLKQEELLEQFMAELRTNFPEAEIINWLRGPENPEEIWIRVVSPQTDERLSELMEFGGNRTIEILLQYGYYFLVVPSAKPTNGAVNGSSIGRPETDMLLNYKQEELINELVEELRQKFPEVCLLDVGPGVDGPGSVWIHVTEPKEEERTFELREFCANKTTDILLDYGYHLLVMSTPLASREAGLAHKMV